jgi:hypothetical protein
MPWQSLRFRRPVKIGDPSAERGAPRIGLVQVDGILIARDGGEGLDVGDAHHAGDLGGLPDLQFVEKVPQQFGVPP